MTREVERTVERDPLAGSAWSRPSTVAGFVQSPPNESLIESGRREWRPSARLLDVGCGAGRNAVPLAEVGWNVVGTDLSLAMLRAFAGRVADTPLTASVRLALAPMDRLPFAVDSFDLIVAHGIWNLARSGAEFRRAVREAARVARPGCALFLFTFSRNTLPATAEPVPGETFVFTQFSGEPQCFLTDAQIAGELGMCGFEPDPSYPLRELNRRTSGELHRTSAPVIFEGVFRWRVGPTIIGTNASRMR